MLKHAAVLFAGLAIAGSALADTTFSTSSAGDSDLNAKLAAARERLQEAAREVAQLSSQIGAAAVEGVRDLRTRAVLGLQLQTEPSAGDGGARVIEVSPGGPAAEAGLRAGDVIVALNGTPTTGPQAARSVVERMAQVAPNSKVDVRVQRGGKSRDFSVVARPNMDAFWVGAQALAFAPAGSPPVESGGPAGPGSSYGASFDGMELATLSPGLGEYFGTDKGVLVLRTPADGSLLKLRDGDVILNIDGRVPENGAHATRILRSYQPGEKIHLKIMRQKKALELEATLPDGRYGWDGEAAPEAPEAPAAPAVPAAPAAPLAPMPPLAEQPPLATPGPIPSPPMIPAPFRRAPPPEGGWSFQNPCPCSDAAPRARLVPLLLGANVSPQLPGSR